MDGGFSGVIKRARIERRLAVSIAVFLGSVVIGFVILLVQKNYPPVITAEVLMDDVYFGKAAAQVPRLSHPNYTALLFLLLFIATVLASREFLLFKRQFRQ